METDTARNMACHRAAQSVWEKRGWSGVTIEERVGPWMVSLVGAAMMVPARAGDPGAAPI